MSSPTAGLFTGTAHASAEFGVVQSNDSTVALPVQPGVVQRLTLARSTGEPFTTGRPSTMLLGSVANVRRSATISLPVAGSKNFNVPEPATVVATTRPSGSKCSDRLAFGSSSVTRKPWPFSGYNAGTNPHR